MRFINLIAIGVFIISTIVIIKMKGVYQISIDGEMIGYIQNKKNFEQTIYETFNNNEEENIAFADFKLEADSKFKFIERTHKSNEQEILLLLKEKADITYFCYTVCVNGEEKQRFTSYEQAKQVVEKLATEFSEEVRIAISITYTKELPEKKNIEVASVCDDIIEQVNNQLREEKRKEQATINGVYIAVVPVKGNVSSRYGARESIRNHTHQGLDIAAKTGTPIKAAADGEIIYSGVMGGYGNLIIIDHGKGIKTYYGHCSKLYKNKGTKVKAGDEIAAVGSTGNSTGPHLHFEIRKNGVYVNPAKYLFI